MLSRICELVCQEVLRSFDKQLHLADLIGNLPWHFDLPSGMLSFRDHSFATQLLGTESHETNTWEGKGDIPNCSHGNWAEDWEWSSLRWWREPPGLPFLDPGPVPQPAELERLRGCIRKGAPFGGDDWTKATVARLNGFGLESSLRAPGRPRKLDEARMRGGDHCLLDSFDWGKTVTK